jgi:hypothetical protein
MNQATEAEEKRKSAAWADRKIITMTPRAFKKLTKTGECHTVENYQWFTIRVSNGPEVFDKNGNQLDKAKLRALLKRMA